MENLNFGEYLIELTFNLYINIYGCTLNYGYASEWFQLTRGSRRGCPYSPLIFILVIEILKTRLRPNPSIQGVQIEGINYLVAQYADDLWLSLA